MSDTVGHLRDVGALLRSPQDNFELAVDQLLELGLGITIVRVANTHVSLFGPEIGLAPKVDRTGDDHVELLGDCALAMADALEDILAGEGQAGPQPIGSAQVRPTGGEVAGG